MRRQKTLLKSIILLTMIFVSCEKDVSVSKMDGNIQNNTMDPGLHNTCTDMIDVKENEALFSLVLSENKGTSDAAVFFSADNMDFDNSVYLTAGINILDSSIDAGPAEKGIKISMPNVCIKERTERIYYFKIVRQGMEDKIVHVSFRTLDCGHYRVTDSNSKNTEQDFSYYIKADDDGDPVYFNIKFN